MPLQLLRRWIARHPRSWVLALALALVGAQTVGAVHALSHGLGSGFRGNVVLLDHGTAATAATAAAIATDGGKAHAAGVDCVTCLAAAALGGAAPAPVVAPLRVDTTSAFGASPVATAWAPCPPRPYAARAPPATHAA